MLESFEEIAELEIGQRGGVHLIFFLNGASGGMYVNGKAHKAGI